MATVIKKEKLNEPMFACRKGSIFEKNSTFDTNDQMMYILLQDDKIIGSTKGKTEYGGKIVKLNKKFFPELKCGLFSKDVNVEIYYIKHHSGYGFSIGQPLKIFGSFPRKAPVGQVFNCLGINFRVEINMSDPKKAYEFFIKKPKASYLSDANMKDFCIEIAKSTLDEVLPNLSFKPGTPFQNLNNENSLKCPESKELFTKFKELYEMAWKEFGYDAKVSLPKE